MPVEVSLDTPLAAALNATIQPKLIEVGWSTGGGEEVGLAEYIILMLVNGKPQHEIANDLANDLLSLPPNDPTVHSFTQWLFDQIETLDAQLNGGATQAAGADDSSNNMGGVSNDGNDLGDMDTDMNSNTASELNAPTGPRSMRDNNMRGGREKRMMNQMSKAMGRTGDGALHRVRGAGINTHGRGPPTGPRNGQGRLPRNNPNRAASIQAGLEGGMGGPGGQQFFMQGGAPSQMELMAILEQQNQMMFQLSQQMMNGGQQGGRGGFGNRGRGGKSLFDRTQNPQHRNGRPNHHQQGQQANADGSQPEGSGEGEDMDMSGVKREAPNPDEAVCKFNLRCTNKDCKFAHQSPAAPPGTTVDVNDVCSFGAACKNRKCVGRHPSPAEKMAHQGEQDCKFYPNCQNPRCPFRHPSMPLCRNGADCTTPNCKFTHVKTKCRFKPCLNPKCAFAHEEGQQGGFKDKVWTSGEEKEHVSERKFVDDGVGEESVRPEGDDDRIKQESMDTYAEIIS